jgi:tRNA threonylcarbamoyl adenosine modification protein YeaZ
VALVLDIDSSTSKLYLRLLQDEICIAHYESELVNEHSSAIAPATQRLLAQLNIPFTALDAVAVMQGPGSYTGLRVGMSFAKGLCTGLDIPLITYSYFEMLRFQLAVDQSVNFLIYQPMKGELIIYDITAATMDTYTYDEWHELGTTGIAMHGSLKEEVAGIATMERVPADKLVLSLFRNRVFADIVDAEPLYGKPTYIVAPKPTL